jgi:predicted lipid-binding transport protein (Tim44 family)
MMSMRIGKIATSKVGVRLGAYRCTHGVLQTCFASKYRATRSHFNFGIFFKGKIMNKLLTALIAGLFAVSVNAFAADAAKPAETAAPVAKAATAKEAPAAEAATAKEKPAAPAKKSSKKSSKKTEKKADETKSENAATPATPAAPAKK